MLTVGMATDVPSARWQTQGMAPASMMGGEHYQTAVGGTFRYVPQLSHVPSIDTANVLPGLHGVADINYSAELTNIAPSFELGDQMPDLPGLDVASAYDNTHESPAVALLHCGIRRVPELACCVVHTTARSSLQCWRCPSSSATADGRARMCVYVVNCVRGYACNTRRQPPQTRRKPLSITFLHRHQPPPHQSHPPTLHLHQPWATAHR